MPKKRCSWCGTNPLYVDYHDNEWGVPIYDDRKLFEFIVLEGAQAGLSWLTILKRREGYRKAFSNFDPRKVSRFDSRKIAALLKNDEIIRNRLKINSAVKNARAFLEIQSEFGSFSEYQWRFVDGQPMVNKWQSLASIPAETPISRAFSKDLKARGFSFVGPTIMYAHMQAVGMVNDHLTSCFRYKPLQT